MINRITERVSSLVFSQLPEFVRGDYALFVTFLEKYYKFLEQDSNAQELIQNARKYRDIDQTIDNLINTFLLNYGPELPLSIVANKKIVIKYLRDFFKSKGNIGSFEYLFRILYNANVSVSYPFEKVLKASNSSWIENLVMKVVSTGGNTFDLKSTTIRGQTSGATAIVENVVQYYENNLDVYELTLQRGSVIGTFLSNEIVVGVKIVSKTNIPDQNLTKTFSGNNRSFVSLLYTTYFERTPATIELDYWTDLIDKRALTKRQVEYDTFVVGETVSPQARILNIVTGISIINGGFGYKVGDTVVVEDKGYYAKGIVTKVKDTGDLNRLGAIREIKLSRFEAKANGFVVPDIIQSNSFPIPSKFFIPPVDRSKSLNVKSAPYNATGDGTTIDETAIQTALTNAGTLATTLGRANVYIPTGTYIISNYLNVPSNVSIIGDGISSIVKKQSSPARLTNLVFRNVLNSNVYFYNLKVEGNKEYANTTSSLDENYGIVTYLSNNIILDRVHVSNVYGIGIGFSNSQNNLAKNCKVEFSGNLQSGFWNGSDTSGNIGNHYYLNCESSYNDGDGLTFATSNVYIYGGRFYNNGLILYPNWPSGALGSVGIFGNYSANIQNVFIQDVQCFNNSESGTDFRGNNIFVSKGVFYNNGLTGIKIEPFSNNITIANCIVYNNGANTSISINPQYWSKSGIAFDGTSNLLIIDNYIGDTRQGNAKTQKYGIEFMNAGTDFSPIHKNIPTSNVVYIDRNYIEGNKEAVSNLDPAVYTYANLNFLTYKVSTSPFADIYTPVVKIRGNYYTDTSNVVYAKLQFNHGLVPGDNVTIKFSGNSQSYLNGTNQTYTILTVKKKNEFTVQAAGPSTTSIVITSDTTTITSDNTYYTSDLTFNDAVITSGYLYVTYTGPANLIVSTGVIGSYVGNWRDGQSIVSDMAVFQGRDRGLSDSDPVKFQPFSYALKTDLDMDLWFDVNKSLVHPVGKGVFSEYTIESIADNLVDFGGSVTVNGTESTIT